VATAAQAVHHLFRDHQLHTQVVEVLVFLVLAQLDQVVRAAVVLLEPLEPMREALVL
jgi:hypothetical protein